MAAPSRGGRVYIALSCAGALVIGVTQLTTLLTHTQAAFGWQLAGISLLAAALSQFRVYGSGDSANYDLAWTLYGLALIYQGVPSAIVVICASNIATMLTRRYTFSWYQHAFNISSFTLAAWVAGLARTAVGMVLAPDVFTSLPAIIAAIAAFTLVNHLHVAGVIWFSERVPLGKSGCFVPAGMFGDIALLGVGALCALVAEVNPFAMILGAAPLYLMYNALRIPRLESQAQTDAKTGLFHSRQFTLRGEHEFERAQRLHRPLTLMMVDLDFLRDINNTHGHLAGDVVIRAVADILQQSALADDVVARFGGEEFAYLMVEHDLQAALSRAECIRAKIEVSMPTLPTGKQIRTTASFGLAQVDQSDMQFTGLIARADEALYTAKHAGRNCVRAYRKSDQVIPPEPHVYNLPETDGVCVMPLRPKLERVKQN